MKCTDASWPDLPPRYGPHQTCFERLRRWTQLGLWQKVLQQIQAACDAQGQLDWETGSGDGSVTRAQQHAAGASHAAPVAAQPGGEWAALQAVG